MTTAFISHEACARHLAGAQHPEGPDRLAAINDRLIAAGLDAHLLFVEAPAADDAALLRVHSSDYLAMLEREAPASGIRHLDDDTVLMSHTLQAARHAAGAGVRAVDGVLAGEFDNAFCAVRPPGHHAGPEQAMGFCIFNNIAVAALHALEAHALERVAIIDFDVHHGNGTEAIFAGDSRVLMASFFQHPFYPYSGTGTLAPNMVNIPVPAATRGAAVREIVDTLWLPALQAHAPKMLFISAGFDAHVEDDLASCGLVEADYAWITERLRAFAEANAGGRVVSMLEGGYALSALGRSVEAHVRALADLGA